MALEPLFDLSKMDLTRDAVPVSKIRELVPQSFEFALLDHIVHFDSETGAAVGYHDLKPDAFWVRGHVPGNPIFPGALMVEAGAQLCSFCYAHHFGVPKKGFFGFGGIDKVKFRAMVRPGQRLWLLCIHRSLHQRYSRSVVQGIVDGGICFEGEITGILLPGA